MQNTLNDLREKNEKQKKELQSKLQNRKIPYLLQILITISISRHLYLSYTEYFTIFTGTVIFIILLYVVSAVWYYLFHYSEILLLKIKQLFIKTKNHEKN